MSEEVKSDDGGGASGGSGGRDYMRSVEEALQKATGRAMLAHEKRVSLVLRETAFPLAAMPQIADAAFDTAINDIFHPLIIDVIGNIEVFSVVARPCYCEAAHIARSLACIAMAGIVPRLELRRKQSRVRISRCDGSYLGC